MSHCRSTFVCLCVSTAMLLLYGQMSLFANDEPSKAVPGADLRLTQCFADLASVRFETRQKAVETLKNATEEQIREIGNAIDTHPDSEVVRRLIEVLELRYASTPLESSESRVVSEALEAAALSKRWFISEASRDVLQRHWQRRIELAVIELVRMGVSLSPEDPTLLWKPDNNMRSPDPFGESGARTLQIHINKSWPADPRAFELLKRIDLLRSENFLLQQGLVAIFLIDGHPLTVEQIAVLKGVFGDISITERGVVKLGLKPEPRFGLGMNPEGPASGVLVGVVEKDSSADNAGIAPGDVLLNLNEERLTDFDQLVTLLRKFDVGDKITLRCRKQGKEGESTIEDVEVVLKGW